MHIINITLRELISNYVFHMTSICLENGEAAEDAAAIGKVYGELLAQNIETIRKEFGCGNTIYLLSPEHLEAIEKYNKEKEDYCVRVLHDGETLVVLAKREVVY